MALLNSGHRTLLGVWADHPADTHTHAHAHTDPRQSSKRGHESHLLSIRDVSGRRHCCVIEVFVFVHPDLCRPAGITRNRTHLLELCVAIFPPAASRLHRGSAAEEVLRRGAGPGGPAVGLARSTQQAAPQPPGRIGVASAPQALAEPQNPRPRLSQNTDCHGAQVQVRITAQAGILEQGLRLHRGGQT